jgi:hypothetical protein
MGLPDTTAPATSRRGRCEPAQTWQAFRIDRSPLCIDLTPRAAEGSDEVEASGVSVELRPLLSSMAYRMPSSVSEAEDMVQEAFTRFQQTLNDGANIASPKAYLSAVIRAQVTPSSWCR